MHAQTHLVAVVARVVRQHSLQAGAPDGRVRPAAVVAGETCGGVAAAVQQQLEHAEMLHAEEDGGWEAGVVEGHVGVDVGSMLQQQADRLHAAL